MIDPVELKALVEKAEALPFGAEWISAQAKLKSWLWRNRRQVLALSDEVERLKEEGHQAHQDRATAAEAEALALREVLKEIREIAIQRNMFTTTWDRMQAAEGALKRIAAVAAIQDGEGK